MELAIFWVGFALLVGFYAEKKGRSGVGWFFLALLISPLLAFLFALLAGEDRKKAEEMKVRSGDYKKCLYCAELIKPEAVVCKHCGRELS